MGTPALKDSPRLGRPNIINQETVKKTEEENFPLHCVQDGQKDGRKKSETFWETPAECSNDSEESGRSTRLLNDLMNHENRLHIFVRFKASHVHMINLLNIPSCCGMQGEA